MTLANRLKLGKFWKENSGNRPRQVKDDHPYIKEYEDSIKAKDEAEKKAKQEVEKEKKERVPKKKGGK